MFKPGVLIYKVVIFNSSIMGKSLISEDVVNKFLLLLAGEDEYVDKLKEIINVAGKKDTKICYICMSRPYKDVIEDLEKRGFDTKKFFFIDVLSSHYGKPTPKKNCIFIDEPSDLGSIREAIKKTMNIEKFSAIIFDTISTLLVYQETSSIVKFAHEILSDEKQENVKKLFIVLKGGSVPLEENERLLKDLKMFADKTINIGER